MNKTKVLIFSTLAIFIFPQLTAAASPKVNTRLPSNSVAVSDDALATFFNPAGLGTGRRFNLYYLRSYQSDPVGDDAFFISTAKAGFGMEFANAGNDIDFNRYTVSSGGRLSGSLYWGTGYSWVNSDDEDYDKLSSLSLGLMIRRRYLSVGAIGRDLNRPRFRCQKLGRIYDIGIALRPSTSRITFSIDARKVEDVDGLHFSYALEIRPVNGFTLRGNLNEDSSFDLHFGFNIGQMGLGTYNRFDEVGKHQEGVGYLHLSQALHTTRHIRRKIFLDVRMGQIEKTLKAAKRDREVVGALIRVGGGDYGLARLQEMRDAILDFKSAGKKVICYMINSSTGNYTLASVSDRIVLHPSGEVRLIGLRSEVSFYRGVLDKLGIRAHLEHVGEYKSASDLFTRTNMSEAHREMQESILDDLYDQLTQLIAEGRSWTQEEVKQLIDQGPFTAKQALENGLVDQIAYRDELEDIAKALIGKHHRLVKAQTYLNTDVYTYDWESPLPKIAIIEATGMMVTGESFTDPLTGTTTMGASTIARSIEATRKDSSIKAVVLRIDSVGGLVIAADRIWRELIQLKSVKPLIVSMGDVAGSGGYYIAVPGDVIVAEPGTITGSIGVIGGKYSLKGLYNKIGLHKEIIKRGKHADFYTDYSDYPAEERIIVQRQIQEIYDAFIDKVANARNMTREAVDSVGRGRIWTGRQAKEHGLVDELGGLALALSTARKRAGLENREVQLVRLPKQSLWSQLVHAFHEGYRALPMRKTTSLDILWEASPVVDLITKHRTFLLMPYQITAND